MLKLLQKRSTLGQSIVWAAFLALGLSFFGNLQKNFETLAPQDRSLSMTVKIVMDTIPSAIKVFRPKPRKAPGTEGWILTIAETLGALVTFVAVLTVLWAVLKEQIEKLRISLLRRHTVLLGFDSYARLFVKSKQRSRDRAVVVVDPSASRKTREKAHAEGCLHYATTNEVELTKQLQACRAPRAERIIVSTGSDAENLEHIKEIAEGDLNPPKDVLMIVKDVKLHHQLEENDGFMQQLGKGTVLRLVNPAKSAAIDLISRVNFNALALAQGQAGVTLVVFGTTNVAAEVVTHFLRVSPSVLSQRPRVFWIVEEQAELQRMLSLDYGPLAALISTPQPETPLAWAVSMEVFETGKETALYDEIMITSLEQEMGHPTAVIVAEDPDRLDKSNVQIGTALRQTSRRVPCLGVPIFVYSEKKSAMDQFLICTEYSGADMPVSQKKLTKTDLLGDVIEPFGRSDEVYNWGQGESTREALAKQLHAEYVQDRQGDADPDQDRAASLAPWNMLPETYKNANRRAVDQLKMLEFSKDQLSVDKAIEPAAVIERLAAIEHDAWWIDRELDGWRLNETRNNSRKFHPNLVPYEALSDEIQEYDRAKARWVMKREGTSISAALNVK